MERAGETYLYTRYEERRLTDQFSQAAPLSEFWVEEIRNDPGQFGPSKDAPEAA